MHSQIMITKVGIGCKFVLVKPVRTTRETQHTQIIVKQDYFQTNRVVVKRQYRINTNKRHHHWSHAISCVYEKRLYKQTFGMSKLIHNTSFRVNCPTNNIRIYNNADYIYTKYLYQLQPMALFALMSMNWFYFLFYCYTTHMTALLQN